MRSQLLDIAQAAALLRVARKTLYKWVEHGQVPFVRIGRLVRFRAEDLEWWVEERLHNSRPDQRNFELNHRRPEL